MALVEVNWTPSARELRQFAAIWCPAFFAIVAAVVLFHTRSLQTALTIVGIALVIALACRMFPAFLRLTFMIWMCASYPIGWLLSHVVLLCLFALVITPVGLLMRLLGYDSLRRRFDGSVKTYWQPCEQENDKTRYLRQF